MSSPFFFPPDIFLSHAHSLPLSSLPFPSLYRLIRHREFPDPSTKPPSLWLHPLSGLVGRRNSVVIPLPSPSFSLMLLPGAKVRKKQTRAQQIGGAAHVSCVTAALTCVCVCVCCLFFLPSFLPFSQEDFLC